MSRSNRLFQIYSILLLSSILCGVIRVANVSLLEGDVFEPDSARFLRQAKRIIEDGKLLHVAELRWTPVGVETNQRLTFFPHVLVSLFKGISLFIPSLTVEYVQYVSFLGALDKNAIPDFLHGLDVLVLPSLAEGMPTVVLEAMASGVSTGATDVGATKTLIDSEDVGVMVPPQTPQAMSQALSRLYSEKETRQKIAKNARKRVEQRYSWDGIASQIEEVYKEVLHG